MLHRAISWLWRPQCAACTQPTTDPLCSACAGTLVEATEVSSVRAAPLARVIAPWRFGGQLATAIRRLKFTGATHVARTLAPLWAPVLAAALDETDGIVVPVPLHWRRRWHRGFDQAWLLATHACGAAGIAAPVVALRRDRAAAPQSTLSAAERAANLAGAFSVADARRVRGRAVILVDDVMTTGATLAAAAEPLLRAGVTTIVGVTLARTES
jgi:ComF family protein